MELRLDGELVGEMDVHDLAHGLAIKRGEQRTVQLGHSYQVDCIVTGGNPPPAVQLSTGDEPYTEVTVTRTTQREPDWMSEPNHKVNASIRYMATVQNIGIELKCASGVENPQSVWTSFIPVVADSKSRRTT